MIFTFPKAEPHEFNLASTGQLLQIILNYRYQKEIQLKLTVYLNQCINTVFLEKSSFFFSTNEITKYPHGKKWVIVPYIIRIIVQNVPKN